MCCWDSAASKFTIILVHCQDLKKIARPSGMVPWIEAPRPKGAPMVPMLGASTMARTSQDTPSVAVLPPVDGAVLADVISVGSVGSSSGCPNTSGMNVSSVPLDSNFVIILQMSVVTVLLV